ncbi:hypothetical protein [Streptomyces sp. FH025]|uniref:hypothetical protein n=1 Tax=Streptomyces sp. FH025 TaxID=2815937 RepID=UPI001A9F6761|nr:hypothetical protein [Streptomyces sp. FH025]MBO1416663.1 hypothetical protein [Streptomyces sp. FH025]
MNALQQHLFDSYRAAQHAEPAPPAPGTHDVAVLRAALDHRRSEAVPADRPAACGGPAAHLPGHHSAQ